MNLYLNICLIIMATCVVFCCIFGVIFFMKVLIINHFEDIKEFFKYVKAKYPNKSDKEVKS